MSATPDVDAERRHVAVLLLAILATGIIDAVCLLHLGVFTAYITGSLIVFAGQFVGADTSAWPATTAILGFVAGALAGARFTRRAAPTHRLFCGGLLVVSALITWAAVASAVFGIDDDAGGTYTTIAALAFAMGIQMALIRRAGVADIALPAATGATFSLLADSRAGGGTPQHTLRRAGMVGALVVGALLGAGISRWEPWAAWAAAAVIVGVAAVVAFNYLPRTIHGVDAPP
jgi:uncharacterized membrane protein YoaK (UPF0700 family)